MQFSSSCSEAIAENLINSWSGEVVLFYEKRKEEKEKVKLSAM